MNTFLKGGFYTDAILPQHSIETLNLGDKMRDITVKEEDKLLIARLASVILAAKPHITMADLFGDSVEARDTLLKLSCINQARLAMDVRSTQSGAPTINNNKSNASLSIPAG